MTGEEFKTSPYNAVADLSSLGTGEQGSRLLGGGTSAINSHIGELAYWRPLRLQRAVLCTEAV